MSGMPITAEDALILWDGGDDVPAFRVESEGATQDAIYWAAFNLIEGNISQVKAGLDLDDVENVIVGSGLTRREKDVALSIAHVAMRKGWAAMVQQHVAGGHIAAILVRKPK